MNDERPVHIMKASRLLQAKVGRGQVKPEKIKQTQDIIDNNSVDFVPLARKELKRLEAAINRGRETTDDSDISVQALIGPVMQLKANAGMFGFPLISDLTTILLDFLEVVNQVDEDILDILDANKKTIHAIVEDRLSGDGGQYGQDILHELKDVCRRYLDKHKEVSADGINLPFLMG